MNYYTYTIHFVDGYYYHGYHKHEGTDPLTDGYFGSPVTHKEKWLTTMHWKEITGLHETIDEVRFAEQEAIRPVFNTDPYCLNANCNGIPLPEQARKGAIKAGEKAGQRAKELRLNVCDPVNQEKGRQTARERGSGFYDPEFQQSEMMKEVRRQNGAKVHEEKDEQGRSLHVMKIHQEKNEEGKSKTAVKAGKGAHKKKNAEGKSEHGVRCGQRRAAQLRKALEVLTPEGIVLSFNSLTEASLSLRIDPKGLSLVARGVIGSVKKHQARYIG